MQNNPYANSTTTTSGSSTHDRNNIERYEDVRCITIKKLNNCCYTPVLESKHHSDTFNLQRALASKASTAAPTITTMTMNPWAGNNSIKHTFT